MRTHMPATLAALLVGLVVTAPLAGNDLEQYFHHDGPLQGTLKRDAPLPIFDSNADHLWNRMYAAFYIRPRLIPANDGRPEMVRYEGGDVIEFLAWGKTVYWSSLDVFEKVNPLLDEFLQQDGSALISDPLKRVIFQHDLWAVYDHLIDQNIKRTEDAQTRARRDILCEKLAQCMQQLALPAEQLARLPDTYTAAIKSGAFVADHQLDPERNYLPAGLLDQPEEWVEIDFYQPETHEDISDRFISLHARSLRGRSYYRIFYRFPEGRAQVVEYLKQLEETGIDWKQAAQHGFVATAKTAPPLPVATEVVLLQLMMAIDDQLRPIPTTIAESIQFRMYRNIDGASAPVTNTGVGINVLDIRMKRHLLFDNLKAGGLERESEYGTQYRVAVDGANARAPDWGFADKEILMQQCVDCHMSRKLVRLGVASVPSIIHSGGFDAGAQIGVAHPLEPDQSDVRGKRVAKYKSRHESFRRLLAHLGK